MSIKAKELRHGNIIKKREQIHSVYGVSGRVIETWLVENGKVKENLVKAKIDEITRKIALERGMNPDDIVKPEPLFDTEDSDYEAILLTEEWLLKFGFTRRCFAEFYIGKYVNGNYFTLYTEDRLNYYFFYESDGVKMKRKISHVHRLQNMYYETTDTELLLIENHE